jgi:hypothetical protein
VVNNVIGRGKISGVMVISDEPAHLVYDVDISNVDMADMYNSAVSINGAYNVNVNGVTATNCSASASTTGAIQVTDSHDVNLGSLYAENKTGQSGYNGMVIQATSTADCYDINVNNVIVKGFAKGKGIRIFASGSGCNVYDIILSGVRATGNVDGLFIYETDNAAINYVTAVGVNLAGNSNNGFKEAGHIDYSRVVGGRVGTTTIVGAHTFLNDTYT